MEFVNELPREADCLRVCVFALLFNVCFFVCYCNVVSIFVSVFVVFCLLFIVFRVLFVVCAFCFLVSVLLLFCVLSPNSEMPWNLSMNRPEKLTVSDFVLLTLRLKVLGPTCLLG